MIETEQSIVIEAPIDTVWRFAQDIRAWANLMPGLQDCTIIDADVSHWTLKVGVGALVRTVTVIVHVDRWAGPGEVDFTYALKGDPVRGGGTYRAVSLAERLTEITLALNVVGTGPMAPMWEAMGKPLLPKFARSFAEQFKAEVEQLAVPVAETAVSPGPEVTAGGSGLARLLAWLRRVLTGKSAAVRE